MRAWLVAGVLACAAAPAWAQQQAPGRACVDLADDRARLDCYDAAFGRAPSPAAETRAGVLPSIPNPFARRDPAPETDFGPPEIAEVAQLARRGGRALLVMRNGDIWAPTGASDQLPRVGEQVAIQRESVGQWLLTSASGLSFRVRKQN